MKIKHKGARQPKIRDISRPARRIDPQELAERLGADIVVEAPNFGGGPMGAMAAVRWVGQRQEEMRKMSEKAGFKPGDHVRVWTEDAEMSVAGRVRRFQLEPVASVVIDCMDGKARTFAVDRIKKMMNFGPPVELPQVGRYKGHAWWKQRDGKPEGENS